ncbi:hypothetical protein GQ42DRAFT_122781 [Ramicandelaber brevisporus]|nr:hypothetical protein GQ42DRAFT_122781 [Ramicandelaber brevisporus]
MQSQSLRCIVLYRLDALRLVYHGTEFCSHRTQPTCLLISRLFGPTHPGEFDVERSVFTLSYPGIAFEFAIPQRYAHLYTDSVSKTANRQQPLQVPDLVLEFPDGTTPVCSRIYVAAAPALVPAGWSIPPAKPKFGRRYSSSMSPQAAAASYYNDVYGSFGSEFDYGGGSSIGGKSGASGDSGSHVDGYIHYYVAYGIDLHFDGISHRVRKIVLHGNLPGHYDFGATARCPYPPSSSTAPVATSNSPPAFITCTQSWQDVVNVLGSPDGSPLILSRGSSSQNPFGSTLLHGYNEGLIFEVTKAGHIANICIF